MPSDFYAKLDYYQKNAMLTENGSRLFLTLCDEGEFPLVINGTERRFCLSEYDAVSYARIRAEADR